VATATKTRTRTKRARSANGAGPADTKKRRPRRQEKKEEPGGLRGLIARRAANWSTDPPDEQFIEAQGLFWNFLVDHYFRMEVRGWERLPDPPALVISIHAGGILPIDAYAFGFQWYREFGVERPLRGTSHDFLMAAPGLGEYLRRIGSLPASPESITAALDAGQDVIIWPGGDLDALRPWTKRDEVVLGGRRGFIKQAIQSQVPIVPVASIGASDTLIVLTDGRRLAKLLRLDKLARSEVFPVALGFPLGIAPGIVPQLPLPAKLRAEILDPVEFNVSPDRFEDDDYVNRKYREVERRLQEGVERLAKRRSFPLFG
jgi:1-acyl-sn-glycerol-3-phosphate acyltransferase